MLRCGGSQSKERIGSVRPRTGAVPFTISRQTRVRARRPAAVRLPWTDGLSDPAFTRSWQDCGGRKAREPNRVGARINFIFNLVQGGSPCAIQGSPDLPAIASSFFSPPRSRRHPPDRSVSGVAGSPSARTGRLNERFGRLPLQFEVNRGQVDPRVRYSPAGGSTLFLTDDEAVWVLSREEKASAGTERRGPRPAAQPR